MHYFLGILSTPVLNLSIAFYSVFEEEKFLWCIISFFHSIFLQLQEYDNDAANRLATTMAMLDVDPAMLNTKRNNSSSNSGPRNWDDDHTIKHHLNALIPAFDPRPGRMNMQQTIDLEIPPPGILFITRYDPSLRHNAPR